MAVKNKGALTAIILSCAIMLGAGLGAAFGSVAIGIPAGLAVGGLAAILVNMGGR